MDNLKYFSNKYGIKTNYGATDGINEEALRSFQDDYRDNEEEKRREEERRRQAELRKKRDEVEAKAEIVQEKAQGQTSIADTPKYDTPYRAITKANKDFHKELVTDLMTKVATEAAQGKTKAEIDESIIPTATAEETRARLKKIEDSLKQGKENPLYNIKEGWMEKEVMNLRSQEAVKEMYGKPNIGHEIDAFMEQHPELQISEGSNILQSGIRGIGELSRQTWDGASYALKDKESWLAASAFFLGGLGVTAATGGTALPVYATTMGSSLAALTPLTSASLGMTYGGMKQMANVEMGLAYQEYIEAGIHPDIARPIAETVGSVNGILEMAEIATILTGIPGASAVGQKAMGMAQSEAKKKIARGMAAYGVNLAENVVEEMVQESNTYMGMELSKYLQDAPNPNTLGGLQALANTMTKGEYYERVGESGIQAVRSMWLMPIATGAARQSIRAASAQAETKARQKAAKGWYDNQDTKTQAFIDEQKKVVLDDNGAIDTLANEVKATRNEKSIRYLVAMEPMLDDMLNRPDLTNQEKEALLRKKELISETIAEFEYEAKAEDNTLDLKPTAKDDIREQVLNGELKREVLKHETYVDNYRLAQEKGIIEIVNQMRAEGNSTSEIIDAIRKKMPKDKRGVIDTDLMLRSIEMVESEVKFHRNMNLISNFETIEGTLNKNEATQADLSTENEQSNAIGQEEEQSPSMEVTEPQNDIESEQVVNKTEQATEQAYEMPKEPLLTENERFSPSDTVRVPVTEINIDPKRFQFRFEGTTDKLAGAEWNDNLSGTVLLWENEHGDLYVVNGHHRVALAQDNNVETLDAKILKGVSEKEARAQGALLNIAEGSASSIDVAKFMRDTGADMETLQKYGIAPKSKIARDGQALSQLDDGLFRMAATRHMPIERAIIIGREFAGNPAAQRSFHNNIAQKEAQGLRLTNELIQEMISQEKGMAQAAFTEQSMFGTVEDVKSLSVERAEVVSYVKGQLKTKKNVLKNVSKEKNAKILESLGNEIDNETNVREMELADQALMLLDKTLNYQGTITNRMFNDFAREYAESDNKAAVKKKALNAFIRAMERGEVLQDAFGKEDATESLTEAMQDELPGQADIFGQFSQLKEMPNIKVVAKHGTNKETHARLMPLIEIMEKNPIFNGLEIIFTGQESTRYMDRSELDAKGYYNAKPGYYTEYGSFRSLPRENIDTRAERGNAQRTDQGDSTRDQLRNNQYSSEARYTRGNISLTNSAQVDTLLHEAIHSIQDILERVDPEFSALVRDWEEQVQEMAKEQGISLPQGKEMLAHALMLGEFGYANDDFNLARAVEVPTEVVVQFRAMLGKDFIEETIGSSKADPNRILKAEFKKLADTNLKDTELAKTLAKARQRRLNKIKMDLRAGETIRYYSPDTTTYAIAIPKDTDYEVSFFNEQGLLTKAVMGVDKLAKKLMDLKLYYNPQEVSYQLKSVNRTQIDSLYEGNETPEMVRLLTNARAGNMTAKDYDTTLKDKLTQVEKDDILTEILYAATQGFDKPNSEITYTEYMNRFYSDKRTRDLRVRDYGFGVEVYKRDFKNYIPKNANSKVPEVILGGYKTASEAIEAHRDSAYHQREVYVSEADLKAEYEDFRDNYETYRDDYSVEFDGQVKFNISYQVKQVADIDTEEFRSYFGNSVAANEDGSPLRVYHGSPNSFSVFSYDFLRTNGTTEGAGFYFTTKKEIAEGYAEGTDNLIEAYLSIQKPLNYDTLTMTRKDVETFIKALDPNGENYLTNYGDVAWEGYQNVLDRAVENEYEYATDDVEVIHSIINANGGDFEADYRTLKNSLGFDGIVVENPVWGEGQKIYIAFLPTQIKSVYNNGQFSLYDPNINYQLKREDGEVQQYSLSGINNFVEAQENKNVTYSDVVDLFNNKILAAKGEVTDRVLPFIKYDAVMGGYDAYQINNGDIVTLNNDDILEIMANGQPLFQLKPEGDLLAVHNLSSDQLYNTLKLGGFPMPSIAITKTDYDHTRYGDVSVFFNKDTIDPKQSANKVYSGDAYTPTFPRIEKKINEVVTDRISEKIDEATSSMRSFRPLLDSGNVQDMIDRMGSFKEGYQDDYGFKLAYLKDKGVEVDPVMRPKKYKYDYGLMDQLKDYFKDNLEEYSLSLDQATSMEDDIRNIINEYYRANTEADETSFIGRRIAEGYVKELGYSKVNDIFDNVRRYSLDEDRTTVDTAKTKEKIDSLIDQEGYDKWFDEISEGIIEREGIRNDKDVFTPSGSRRSWDSLHYDVTLDNILKAMKGEDETASGMFGGIGRFGAAASRVFTSISDIKGDMDRLTTMDEETYQAMRDEYNDRLIALASQIADKTERNEFMAVDRAFEAMIDAIQNSKTAKGVMKTLKEYRGLNVTEEIAQEIVGLATEVAQMPTEYFEAKPRRAVGISEIAAVALPLDVNPEIVAGLKQNNIHFIEYYDRNIEGDRQRAVNEILGKNDVSFQLKKTDTDTKAFKEFFGNSKLVDAEGKPLIMYHGTNDNFSKFLDFTPMFFSKNSEYASGYTEKGNVMEVYLRIEEPFDTRENEMAREVFNTEFADYYKEKNPNQRRPYLEPGELPNFTHADALWLFLRKSAREGNDFGFDGLVIDEKWGMYYDETGINASYVPLSNTQIKSVYNQGSWSATNPDIYYQLKDEKGRDFDYRSWTDTVAESQLTSPALKEMLLSREFIYEVAHNEDSLIKAAELIEKKGTEYVKARLDSDIEADAIIMAAGEILTFAYMNQGDTTSAMEMTSSMARKTTTMGQGIQILSQWNKQTPTGMLRYVEREFESLATDKQRDKVKADADKLTKRAIKINKKAIKELDLGQIIDDTRKIDTREWQRRKAAQTEQGTQEFMAGLEPEVPSPTDIDKDIIIQALKDHYSGEKPGDLYAKLLELGLNDNEARLIADTVKQQMRDFTAEEMQKAISEEVKGKAKAVDEQMKDLLAEGRFGEALRKMVGQKQKVPVLTSDMVNMIFARGQEIQKLPPGREKDVETAKLWRDISEQMPVPRGKKIATFHTMMMLLNFKTMARNLIGNTAFAGVDIFTLNTLGAGIDKIYSEMNGTQRTTTLRLMDSLRQNVAGYKQGGSRGIEDAKMGIDTSDMGTTKHELGRGRAFDRNSPAGKLETALNIGLRATDRAAVMAAYFDSIAEQMEITGATEVTQEMHDRALKLGLYRTFNDETKLSRLFSEAKRTLNLIGLPNREFGLGDLVLKFPRTPANIMARAIDYSPAGLLTTMLKVSAESDTYLKQRMTVEGLSRAIAGSGVIGVGIALASMGILLGSEPDEDKDLYELQQQSGLREFSVNASAVTRWLSGERNAGELRPGDKLASYDWAQPLSIPLAIGADAVYGNGDTLDFISTVVRATEAGITTLTEQPLLTGVANLFRYGDPVQGFTNAMKGMPASFSPSIVSQVAQAIHGGATNPYSFYPVSRQAWNMVANKWIGDNEFKGLPLGRGAIPERVGVLGEEERWFGDDGLPTRLAKSMLSPMIMSDYMPPEEAQFLMDLYEATGDPSVIPNSPQKQYTVYNRKGEKVVVKPTAEEYVEWSKWLGENTREDINRMMEGYGKHWDPLSQADEVKYLINERRKELKDMIERDLD